MAFATGLQFEYVPLAAGAPARWDDVLGIATFGVSAPFAAEVPAAHVHTPVLGSNVYEIWRTDQRIESGQCARVQFRRTEELLFGSISLTEASGLHTATEQAYREIFATVNELGYPHLARLWNYLPQINIETDGLERYRQFNSARRNALIAYRRDLTGNVPAACALGSIAGSPLVIYFVASRQAVTAVENPRQVSAYEYPEQYGPKPAFSRASILGNTLFISGTASIVGHETVHVGDVTAQTRETLANIEALVGEANRVSGAGRFNVPRFDVNDLAYKVYVRHATDLPLVRSQLDTQAQVLYLLADVCREDLLVEIEALGRAR
jgi:enamine deaminase RidA (YjgF/YER057c/UK114 family)